MCIHMSDYFVYDCAYTIVCIDRCIFFAEFSIMYTCIEQVIHNLYVTIVCLSDCVIIYILLENTMLYRWYHAVYMQFCFHIYFCVSEHYIPYHFDTITQSCVFCFFCCLNFHEWKKRIKMHGFPFSVYRTSLFFLFFYFFKHWTEI